MSPQPNPILASSLPGFAVGDWENPSGPPGAWQPIVFSTAIISVYAPAAWMVDPLGRVWLDGVLQVQESGGIAAFGEWFQLPYAPIGGVVEWACTPLISGVTRAIARVVGGVPQFCLDGAVAVAQQLSLTGLSYRSV
jgi:hypothetical protein